MRRPVVIGIAAAVALGLALLWLAGGPGSGPTYRAEFADASGLLPGNDVRVGGAIAGSVESVSLTRRGTASVEFSLDDDVAHPRRDAVAAIRPVDLLGDNYMALSPGSAQASLDGPIPVAHTSNAPRLDDVLRVFRPRARNGMRALLVEGGLALDRRGTDLARTAVLLRPAFTAADGVATELGQQNARLGPLVDDAERAASLLASRERDLGGAIDGLAGTLHATGSEAPSLQRAVAGMPALLTRVRSVAGRLGDTAVAATPLARSLASSAAPLGEALQGAPPLVDAAGSTAARLRPAVRSTRSLLVAADPTLKRLATALPALRSIAPDTDKLLAGLDKAAPGIADGFFVNFPDQAAEPGDQPFDPFADPKRAYWRGAAVFSCEAFGVKISPGCLDRVLARQKGASAGGPPPAADSGAVATTGDGHATGGEATHHRSRHHHHRRRGHHRRGPDLNGAIPAVPSIPATGVADSATPAVDAATRALDYLLGP